MSDDSQDKSQKATPHKLREAQKKGQVAKSQEANYAAVLAALVGICFAAGPAIGNRVLVLSSGAFQQAGRTDWASDNVATWLVGLVSTSITVLLPLLLAVVIMAVVVNVSQIGGVFSFDPVSPDFNRLNPATGLKRIFSMKLLYDAFKSVLKLTLLGFVAWFAMRALLPDLMKLSFIDAKGHAAVVMSNVGPLLFKLFLAILLIALIDLLYTRWEFAKKMRMSHKDISDEHKQREGDPRIRSRLRQLRQEMLKQARSMKKLPEADVLITNPTHIAIALSYRHGEMPAPKLLAKGSGKLAARMREKAREHNIPIVENRPLARELYKRTGSDQFVPEDLYPRVAKILIWVYAMRQGRPRPAAAGRPA